MTPDEAIACAALRRLQEVLQRIGDRRAAQIGDLLARASADPAGFWRALNANDWWGGAGSLAAATMADPPALPADLWRREVITLREALIEIGEVLMRRGGENPGISSWVLAFRNWSASGV